VLDAQTAMHRSLTRPELAVFDRLSALATPKTAGTAEGVDRNLDLAMSPTQFVLSFTLA
jgi:hypothetical protein